MELLSKYHLDDNNLVFKCVQNHIDGLQKDLLTTITWFGLVFIILALILIGILLALATFYRITNQERLNVEKFLGYGFLNMYMKPMILLGIVILLELLIILFSHSKFGFLIMSLLAFLQILVFSKYMT